MSEQSGKSAHGADGGRPRREEDAAHNGAHGDAAPDDDHRSPGSEPVHPWQGGSSPADSRVPAAPAGSAEHAPSGQSSWNGYDAAADPEASRLEPRPVQQPAVDPDQSAAFGRPAGVSGSFAPEHRTPKRIEQAPPPSEALTKAFGRPSEGSESLQRAPGDAPASSGPAPDETFWSERGEHEPWRNPAASAVIGPPAVSEEPPDKETDERSGPLLSTREVLFGRRVHPRTLASLAAIAVLLAVVGGFIGRITAEEGNPLTNPDVTLTEVEPREDRQAGSVAEVAQEVVPAVVSVEVRVGAQGGTGSGVVIDGEGYVVTNNHVVSMAADTPDAQISAVFHDGTRAPARLVGRDVKTDLAVIKVDVSNPTVAQLGSSKDLIVGEDVIAIGSPLGLASTVTTGIVSSTHRPVRLAGEGTDTNAVIDAIQTDAAVNPGNSGGALVNGDGAIIGINSAIRTLGSGGEGGSIGLGFAIPIDDARRIATELIRTGQVQHADLGVNAKSVNDGMSDGAQVQNVRDGSAAAGADIAEGDVIIQVGEREVGGADELIVAVDQHQVGETVPVTIVRQGRELVLDVTLS